MIQCPNPSVRERRVLDFGFWHSLDIWALAFEIKCLAISDLRLFKDKNRATGNPCPLIALSIVIRQNVENLKLAFQ